MAIDETKLPISSVGGQNDETDADNAESRSSADDFQLRLDSPLFHRDAGMSAAHAPQLRELTWEHVVRPNQQVLTHESDELLANELAARRPVTDPSTPSIESLLAQTRVAAVQIRSTDALEPTEASLPVAQPVIEDRGLSIPEPEPPAASLTDAHVSPVRPGAGSAVEAELNRLAFLPDHEAEVGPVVVPVIASTEQHSTSRAPVLAHQEMFLPRKPPAPVPHRVNPVELASIAAPLHRKKKRHVLRRLLTLIVLFGMVGGGLFAAKYYLLDKPWSDGLKPLVDEVEKTRGLSFDHAIVVTTLPVDEYAAKLATLSLGITDENSAMVAGEWRSLGLLNGALTVRSIGMAAMPDSPAFYDATSETIFVADGLPTDLYRFGMQRALTLALLDQQYGWSKQLTAAAPSVVRGTRAFYDADALATAVELTTAPERTNIVTQIFGLYGTYQIAASPSPFATAVSGRLGLALRPYFESIPNTERGTVATSVRLSDGQVLDIRRLLSGAAEVPGAQSRGMLYWYHALASRIGEDTAWQAALAWQDDEVSVVNSANGPCVFALVQVDPASLDSVTAAFRAWAAAAPGVSATTVAPAAGGSVMQLQINACDPGPGVATNDGHGYLALGGAPLRAEQYRQLLVAQPALPPAQAACAVYGGDSVSLADERGVIDNADGWPVPAAHPIPDPNRLGCAPA